MRCSAFLIALLAHASSAHAFLEPSQFFAPGMGIHSATLGAGAEGVYFTGAPRYSGLDCSTCHTDGPQRVTLQLGADDESLFTTGYVPGQTYQLAVTLGHETEGLMYSTASCTEVPPMAGQFTYEQCNNNNFALEIDSAAGPLAGSNVFCAAAPAGGACPDPDDSVDQIVVAPDGDAVFANDAHSASNPFERLVNDATTWRVWWTAPVLGTGPVTIYVAAVDGNGGSGTVVSDQDPYGDDTVRGTFDVKEAGSGASLSPSAGCSSVPGDAHRSVPIAALALLVVLLRRRRVSC